MFALKSTKSNSMNRSHSTIGKNGLFDMCT